MIDVLTENQSVPLGDELIRAHIVVSFKTESRNREVKHEQQAGLSVAAHIDIETGATISTGREELAGYVESKVTSTLGHLAARLTRVEVHLSDENAIATDIPPRSPPQVSTFQAPWGSLNVLHRKAAGNPTVSNLATNVTTIASALATARLVENETSKISIPIKTNNVALRISSISSQNMSTYRRISLDIASARPWLPIIKPAKRIAAHIDQAQHIPLVSISTVKHLMNLVGQFNLREWLLNKVKVWPG